MLTPMAAPASWPCIFVDLPIVTLNTPLPSSPLWPMASSMRLVSSFESAGSMSAVGTAARLPPMGVESMR